MDLKKKEKPKFSVGYNGSNVSEYIAILDRYKSNIDSVYLSVPFLYNSHHKMPLCSDYNDNVLKLLKRSVPYKKFLAMNNVAIEPYSSSVDDFIKTKLKPFVEEYGVDGIIVADFRMATAIRYYLPDILLDSSCNSYIFTAREAKIWDTKLGIHCINPPRDVLRQPELLNKLSETGLKLKCIVNESCLIGCPTAHRHNIFIASQDKTAKMVSEATESGSVNCVCGDDSNFFRSNWVLPRWLDLFDDKVSIYKLSTRPMDNYRLYKTLDAYINRKEVDNIFDIIIDGTAEYITSKYKGISINSVDIPDRLIMCGCSECGDKCNLCGELKKLFEEK